MRMFVAIRPPDHVIEDLDDFLAPRREASRLRWTHPETWHLTLAFMAEVPDRSRDELEERLASAAARRRSFALRLAGGGAFPDPTRAKVLYADVRPGERAQAVATSRPTRAVDAGVELDRLAVGARAAAATSGAPPDGASFVPHLTLARMNRPVEATRWLRVLGAYQSPTWTVEEIELVASYLGEGPRGRPRYETLGTFPLDLPDQSPLNE
jgi:2'-5' RNA ligase